MSTRYTKDHEWVRMEGDVATIGISAYAAEQLGDVVYVELPAEGAEFAAGRGHGGGGKREGRVGCVCADLRRDRRRQRTRSRRSQILSTKPRRRRLVREDRVRRTKPSSTR